MKKYISKIALIASIIILSGCGASIFNAGANIQSSKQLVAQGNVNMRGVSGFTSLHVAAENGNLEIIKYLIANGAQVNARSNAGFTPLMSSISANNDRNTKSILYLIEKGADINVKDNTGKTLLFWAVTYGHMDNIKTILKQKVDINQKDNTGYTPILKAAFDGKTEIIKYLIKNNADINAKTNNGDTALILAAWNAKPDTVRYLLDIGLDLNIKNNASETAQKKVDDGIKRWGVSTWAQAKIYVSDYKKITTMLKESSIPENKVIKLAYNKAKKEDTIRGYEIFIATYPNSIQAKQASKLAKTKLEKLNADPKRKKEMLDKIIVFLKKKNVDGLLAFANANPDVIEFSRNQPKIYLLFTGPTELQVGKILQYKSKGISEGILISKIKNLNKPYRKYSLDEISILTELGLSDKLLIAMLDVTTTYEKERRQIEAQNYMLKSQERIAKENKNTTTTNVYKTSNNSQNNQTQKSVGDKVMDKAVEKGVEMLINNLF